MSLWLVLAILLASTGALLGAPFMKPRSTTGRRRNDPRIAFLNELDRASAMGEIDPQTAESERVAIESQLKKPPSPQQTKKAPRVDGLTGVAILAVIILGAVALYAVTSAVATPDGELAAAPGAVPMQTAAKPLPDVDTMISRLADRLKASPNDAEGWRMLGWSYFETRRFPESVSAYARSVALQPNSAALLSAYGEAMSAAASGRVSSEALQAFRAALKIDAKDERARYYLALADKQAGKSQAALEAWITTLREAPAGSLWSARLRARIADTARELNVDVTARLPPPSVLPEKSFAAAGTAQQIAALSPGEQQAMIANMVEGLDQRLARAPNDPEGWVRLIRSRKVLGQMDLARASLNRALTAFKNDAQTRARVQAAAANLGVTAN